MTRSRSGPFAAWCAAWLLGQVGPDEVIDAVTADDAPHGVVGLVPGLSIDGAKLLDVMTLWRRRAAAPRVLFPVPGDVRGLPGPAAFRQPALDAGEALCAGGVGLVPEITEYYPSSAPTTVTWQAFETDDAPPDFVQLAEAQYDLTTAIRECASALAAADVAGSGEGVSVQLDNARRAGECLNLPRQFPSRAVTLLAQAERMQAVLELALADPVGGAVDRMGMAARASALRPLETAVRRARLAGYNALADLV